MNVVEMGIVLVGLSSPVPDKMGSEFWTLWKEGVFGLWKEVLPWLHNSRKLWNRGPTVLGRVSRLLAKLGRPQVYWVGLVITATMSYRKRLTSRAGIFSGYSHIEYSEETEGSLLPPVKSPVSLRQLYDKAIPGFLSIQAGQTGRQRPVV